MKKKLLNIDIHSLRIGGIDQNDYPKFSDAYISEGCDVDGNKLSDEELNAITENNNDLVNRLATEFFWNQRA